MRKTTRRGEAAERFFCEELKEVLPIKPTSNSGARDNNGDLSTPDLLIDVKSTEGEGLPKVSRRDWEKIRKQALALGKDFIIPVVGKDRQPGVIFPLDLAKRALAYLYPGEGGPAARAGTEEDRETIDDLVLRKLGEASSADNSVSFDYLAARVLSEVEERILRLVADGRIIVSRGCGLTLPGAGGAEGR